jgi:hypothetical protein
VALVAALSCTCLPLGGCAVSLFSDHELGSEDRIEALEKRMDAIEQRLPPAPPRPASPPSSAPSSTPSPAPAGTTK